MDKEILDQITLRMGIISGFVFLAIIIPLRIYWRKQALNKIKSMLDNDEEIIYQIRFPFSVDYVAPFCVGGFFGSFILPFFIFKNIFNVGAVTVKNLYFFIFAEIISFLLIIVVSSIKEILTSKRIKRLSKFLFLNKIMKKLDLPIYEIKSIEYKKCLFLDSVEILTKTNVLHTLAGYKDMDKIKEYLDNLLCRIDPETSSG